MAKKVWYVGHVDAGITLTNGHWKQRVGEDKPSAEWKQANGFSVDADQFTARQLQWFESQADFYVVDTDATARAADAVPLLESSFKSGGTGGGGVTTPVPASGGIVITDTVVVSTPTPVGATVNQAVTPPTTVTDSVKPAGVPVLT